MRIVSLLKHSITVVVGEEKKVFVPSGQEARCSVATEKATEIDGIPVNRSVFGQVLGLPEPVEGTIYIVSTLVAQQARRPDVVSPDTGPTAIREGGQVVAVRGFQTF